MSSVRRILLVVLTLAAILTAIWWRSGSEEPPVGSAAVETAPAPPAPPAVPASGVHTGRVMVPSFTPRPSAPRLQGRDLAVAWLQGYLTRSSRDDDRWESAIADLSSPGLVAELRESGPDWVGLNQLDSWRVARIRRFRAADQPVSTTSRMSLGYAVAVTDGHHTFEKPFVLYAYRQPDGRWLVTVVDQPYASEG